MTKPSTALEQAVYIWTQQDKLNAASSLTGTGTIDWRRVNDDVGGRRSFAEVMALQTNYRLALHDEVTELIGNFIWKHWAKEAREGRRFELIRAGEEAGEGTAQNVEVELTDILFFSVSLLQIETTYHPDLHNVWALAWGSDEKWKAAQAEADKLAPEAAGLSDKTRLAVRNNNAALIACALDIEQHIRSDYAGFLIETLMTMFALAGVSRQRAFDLYDQKLQINYDRINRGRKQVGDTQAHIENESVGR